MTLPELSKKMQGIDFSMLFTRAANGAMAGRPMSNNGDVEYDGDSYFFTSEKASMAALIRDKASFSKHWTRELDRWFDQGVNTPGVVLIKVHAQRVHFWEGEDSGEVRV
jgi:general stress protein 26